MSDERRHPADELKLIGLIGALLVVMFGWVYNSITDLREKQWSEKQQTEYRVGRDRELADTRARLDRLETELLKRLSDREAVAAGYKVGVVAGR